MRNHLGQAAIRRSQEGLTVPTSSFALIVAEALLAAVILWFAFRSRHEFPESVADGRQSGLENASRSFSRLLTRCSRGNVRPLVLCGIVSLVVSATGAAVRWPIPAMHDEFSNLLAADTFCHGRLTNPTHSQWVHFESMHILQQPTYASKYPPLQGLFLAVGQSIFGSPVFGVWLSTTAAVAAVAWMLQAWVPARWAFFGGLITALHIGLHLRWGQTYMGGAPAVFGSALLIGAYRRWIRSNSAFSSVAGAMGLMLLANSRPFEGFLISLPIVGSVLIRVVKRVWRKADDDQSDARNSDALVKVAAGAGPTDGAVGSGKGMLAAATALIAGVIGMLVYNQQITGHPLLMPYSLHSKTYMSGALFVGSSIARPAPEYRHAVMKDFHSDWELDSWSAQRTATGFLRVKARYYSVCLFVLCSPVLMIVFLVGLRSWLRPRRAENLVVLAALLLMLLGSIAAVWVYPHYLSPGLPIILLVAITGARRAWCVHHGIRRTGRQTITLLTGLSAVMCLATIFANAVLPREGWPSDRDSIIRELEAEPGPDLVIVRYAPNHSPHEEWVYNRADLDSASVVWARDMGAAGNQGLLDHFRDRRIWMLDADAVPRKLAPMN